ncbi:MAG: DUF5596 domain-containing protein [Clostridia bacterium]|nr:DUF5596 domain-containing protein [Clostridia bacterium]
MKAHIKSFCTEYDYPEEAIQSLLADFDALKKTECYPLFRAYVDLYEADDVSFDHAAALRAMRKISEITGINRYALDLLLYICLARHCRELYDEAGIPVRIYHDSMKDLKWKLMECKKVHGVWGSFVASWFPRFFDLSRFALGRLQFEDDPSVECYEKNGIKLNYGDWVIGIHIPSAGKLNIDDCMDSLRQASEFFADRFPDGVAKFRCHSWLLAGNHKDYLAPETGIRKFAELFDVVKVTPHPEGYDLWRIFGKEYSGSTEGFPAETSLQRAYLKMLADGNAPETGLGFIFMKDGEIIR